MKLSVSMEEYDRFTSLKTNQEFMEWQIYVKQKGFSAFYHFLEGFRSRIKSFEDDESDDIQYVLQQARQALPDPVSISPSWENVWNELEDTIASKLELMQHIPVNERAGEWQIIMHNPYTTQEVVCYPHLNFLEAAYLYGYFKPQLNENEYIQIQKIETKLKAQGSPSSLQ